MLQVLLSASSLAIKVTQSKIVNLFVVQFPHLQNRDSNKVDCPGAVWGLNSIRRQQRAFSWVSATQPPHWAMMHFSLHDKGTASPRQSESKLFPPSRHTWYNIATAQGPPDLCSDPFDGLEGHCPATWNTHRDRASTSTSHRDKKNNAGVDMWWELRADFKPWTTVSDKCTFKAYN